MDRLVLRSIQPDVMRNDLPCHGYLLPPPPLGHPLDHLSTDFYYRFCQSASPPTQPHGPGYADGPACADPAPHC